MLLLSFSPSSVIMALPSTFSAGVRHDNRNSPSISTEQLPQPPWAQPDLIEVRPSLSLSTLSNV